MQVGSERRSREFWSDHGQIIVKPRWSLPLVGLPLRLLPPARCLQLIRSRWHTVSTIKTNSVTQTNTQAPAIGGPGRTAMLGSRWRGGNVHGGGGVRVLAV